MLKSQKIFVIIVCLAFFSLFTVNVLAETAEPTLDLTNKLKNVGGAAGFNQPSEESTLPEIIGNIINGFLSLLGMVFMGYIIYGGYLWLTARGEEEKIDKAKRIIRGSITGIIIVLAAYAITAFVVGRLVQTTGFTSPATTSGATGG
ncbi:MAG: hypothetical protein A2729_01625 [Candidatus Buchananbacteria bacterium RIFCSPHIGHO2_01_FULL_39_14]|uniref:DUF4190 domain-containing protein n=2 Tax=Candidatus Buchananiibacteriota TaxID=1817903 RepID=A0A1G1YP87_9BACT|nr:MAG: hypothetical protein A2729_01625 [Candidatus Buchananbacteria bacterium RIFCSPHIGHO2_01_FULL_39_14]OGY48803.1 MAG: hypothetical protein A3D39_03295 [Candidatus Buchananbacteria bacterium RIFCSPHIGHO2_02_FULL_39_17]OGY54089.1 MAG: hypothetical protein A2912_01820 [Candidatus Buchananbacteria bacterium RIFCSPLOWO2_01_FULL_40_23b]